MLTRSIPTPYSRSPRRLRAFRTPCRSRSHAAGTPGQHGEALVAEAITAERLITQDQQAAATSMDHKGSVILTA
jgi:hypothetical protein